MTKPINGAYFGFILCFKNNDNINSLIFVSATTDRKPNNAGWLRRAIIKIIYYPLSQGSPNFFEGGPDNNETISLRAGQIIQSYLLQTVHSRLHVMQNQKDR